MSSKRAKVKTSKKRPQRATSNVFAMFDQSQIQEFKEAFNMIDQNRDGFIDKEDLHDMLASLGNVRPVIWLQIKYTAGEGKELKLFTPKSSRNVQNHDYYFQINQNVLTVTSFVKHLVFQQN